MAKLPSQAQSRLLARVWGSNDRQTSVMTEGPRGQPPYNDPTLVACLKRGWFQPVAQQKEFANGTKWIMHELTNTGTDALEDYLRETRYRRGRAAA